MSGVNQCCRRLAKKLIPTNVRKGLRCIAHDGMGVFVHKVENRLKKENQYQLWIDNIEKFDEEIKSLQYEPMISVVVPVYNVKSSMLTECIESVRAQTYKNWQLCLVDDCSTMESVRETLKRYEDDKRIKIEYRKENGHISRATNTGIAMADGEYIGLLDCDDILARDALYEMVKLLNDNPEYDFIYSDEDKVNENGKKRQEPFFKPDWSPDTFMSIMYTCHFSIFRKSLIDELGGMRVGYEGSQDYDLVLRVMEKTDRIGHVPRMLYHWRMRDESTASSLTAKPYVIEATIKAKMDALERRGLKGHVEYIEMIKQFRVVYEPLNNPKVSIIVVTKDNHERLKECIEKIVKETEYDNYEIIVVDNGSAETDNRVLCDKYKCLYHRDRKSYNHASLCNIGAEMAHGEYLLFMSDNVMVNGKEWLSRLLGQAQVSYTGAVSCKLLYSKGERIFHAGITNLAAGPARAFYKLPDNRNYYSNINVIDCNFSIVTSACFLIEKNKFDEAGRFDESFPQMFGDAELCFRLIEKGYYNVIRNDVTLLYHESAGHIADETGIEKKMVRRRALESLYRLHPDFSGYDPCYNPNLIQTKGDFSIRSKC